MLFPLSCSLSGFFRCAVQHMVYWLVSGTQSPSLGMIKVHPCGTNWASSGSAWVSGSEKSLTTWIWWKTSFVWALDLVFCGLGMKLHDCDPRSFSFHCKTSGNRKHFKKMPTIFERNYEYIKYSSRQLGSLSVALNIQWIQQHFIDFCLTSALFFSNLF